jgi:hypothetical protein
MIGQWHRRDIRFDLALDHTDGGVATLKVMTPAGDLLFMGEPEKQGSRLIARGVHVNGANAAITAGTVGAARLLLIAQVFLEVFDYEELILEGALRTTGGRPGVRPRVMRFARRPVSHKGG